VFFDPSWIASGIRSLSSSNPFYQTAPALPACGEPEGVTESRCFHSAETLQVPSDER
jgi:hypothetical protein